VNGRNKYWVIVEIDAFGEAAGLLGKPPTYYLTREEAEKAILYYVQRHRMPDAQYYVAETVLEVEPNTDAGNKTVYSLKEISDA